eukprot:6974305-Prymnesium_polylepis.1
MVSSQQTRNKDQRSIARPQFLDCLGFSGRRSQGTQRAAHAPPTLTGAYLCCGTQPCAMPSRWVVSRSGHFC